MHIGAQPNSSPYLGNNTTFALASYLRKHTKKKVQANFVYVDTAPSYESVQTIQGVTYQRSLSSTSKLNQYAHSFVSVLYKVASLSNMPYTTHKQDLWRQNENFIPVVQSIIDKREYFGAQLSLRSKKLAIRTACLLLGCGLADKYGILKDYSPRGKISCMRGIHGRFDVCLDNVEDVNRLGFNTPLRNLIRIMLVSKDEQTSWVMCTGSDYAGIYQENFLWRLLPDNKRAPAIFYAP